MMVIEKRKKDIEKLHTVQVDMFRICTGSYYSESKRSDYDLLEVQRLMDGFMNMSSSAEARVL